MSSPDLRIVRGDATPDEIAALISVLAVRARRATEGTPTVHGSEWADRSRDLRTPLPHGPGAWRASTHPR